MRKERVYCATCCDHYQASLVDRIQLLPSSGLKSRAHDDVNIIVEG